MKFRIIIFFLLILIPLSPSSTVAEPAKNQQNSYELFIVASQWKYEVYDLVDLGIHPDAFLQYIDNNRTNYPTIGTEIEVRPNTDIILHFASIDVQYGVDIDELNISLIMIRPTPDNRYFYVTGTGTFPNHAMTIKSTPTIFAGKDFMKMALTFYVDSTIPTPGISSLTQTILISSFIGLTVITSGILFRKQILQLFSQQSKIQQVSVFPSTTDIIAPLFNSETTLVNLLVAAISKETSDSPEIPASIRNMVPQEMYEFKFLMNPIRLAIVKLLDENVSLTSVEVKTILKISKGEFYTHLDALKKHQFVISEDKFIHSNKQQVLTLSTIGMERYSQLKEILVEFLTNTTKIADLVSYSHKFSNGATSNSLYPKN